MSKQPFKYAISDFSGSNVYIVHKTVQIDYKLHWHECCELEIILSGDGTQILNGVSYPLRSGEVYMLTPADCHSIHVEEPLEIIGIMFEDKIISQTLYERVLTRETLGLNLTANMSGRHFVAMMGLVDALLCVYKKDKTDTASDSDTDFNYMYIGHIIDCLIIELLRNCRSDDRGLYKSPIGTAILYLHSHFTENITLDTLAKVTHLSRNYFSELFKQSTGRTFKGYLIDLRMKNACRLLANTEMSVTDVCFSCGFESFSNFMRTFKSKFNTSPLKFRAENRIERE